MPIDPVTGAIVANVASSLISGIAGSSAQKKANKANIKLQRENQAWMEKMSNTAYQRGTADMLSAGLNPMLAFSQGGASTPSSSAATVQPEDAFARSISSAGNQATRALELQNLKAITEQNKEKAVQEALFTEREMVKQGRGAIKDKDGNVIKEERPWFLDQLEKGKSEAELKALEMRVAQELAGPQVSSARAMAEIHNKEVDIKEAELILKRLDIPEKEAMAKWFETVGAASPAAKAAMTIGQWLKFIFGGN